MIKFRSIKITLIAAMLAGICALGATSGCASSGHKDCCGESKPCCAEKDKEAKPK